MLIAIARRSGIIVATVVVVAVSAILWPLENSERRLAASGAKLCYALDETLLVGAKLEGEAFGDEQVQVAASVSSMQRLSLAGSLVTQRGIQSLMLAKKLSSLNLSDTNLTSDALAIVCGFPLLRELELNRCGWLRDEHLSQLAALQKLEFLSLTGTSVTAVGMEHLRQVPALKFVRLVDCRGIDDSSIDAVIRLCERRNLSIDLSGTEVTLQGLTRLRGAVPNGRIYFHPDSLVGLREISQRGQFFQDQLGEIIGFRRKGDTDGTVIPLPGPVT